MRRPFKDIDRDQQTYGHGSSLIAILRRTEGRSTSEGGHPGWRPIGERGAYGVGAARRDVRRYVDPRRG